MLRPQMVAVVLIVLLNDERLELTVVEELHIRDVTTGADNRVRADLLETFDIVETGEGTVGGCGNSLAAGYDGGRELGEPRLSAAITTPPLNLTATTEVPVTMGCCVCCVAPAGCRKLWL